MTDSATTPQPLLLGTCTIEQPAKGGVVRRRTDLYFAATYVVAPNRMAPSTANTGRYCWVLWPDHDGVCRIVWTDSGQKDSVPSGDLILVAMPSEREFDTIAKLLDARERRQLAVMRAAAVA